MKEASEHSWMSQKKFRNLGRTRWGAKRKVLPLRIPSCRANGSLTSDLWLTIWAAIAPSALRKVQLAQWLLIYNFRKIQMSLRSQSCSSLLPHKCQLIFFHWFLFKVLKHKGLRKGLVILSFKDICYKIRTYSRSNIQLWNTWARSRASTESPP